VPIDAPEAALVMIDDILSFSGAAKDASKTKITKPTMGDRTQTNLDETKVPKKLEAAEQKPMATQVENPKEKISNTVKEAPKVQAETPKIKGEKIESPAVAKAQADIARMRSMHPGLHKAKSGRKIDRTPVLDRKFPQKPKHFDDVQQVKPVIFKKP
jgi:hypothetical protein